MKTLPYFFIIVLFTLGCEQKSSPQTFWFDTIWIDESPVDTEVLNKIYNAETIEDIFPWE